MSKYTKELEKRIPDALDISQVDSKQMAVVIHSDNTEWLYSYWTKVGRHIGGTWYLTTEKYSTTTSKQLTQFSRNCSNVKWVSSLENLI